jgi:hypothetical protein
MQRNAGANPQTKLTPETKARPRMRNRPSLLRPSLLERRYTVPNSPPLLTSGDFDYHVDLVGDEPSPPSAEPPAATTSREAEGGLIAPREPGKFCSFPNRAGKFNPFGLQKRGTKALAAIEALNDARKEKAAREARDAETAFEEEASKHWYPPQ